MLNTDGLDLAHSILENHSDLIVWLALGWSHMVAQNGTYGFKLLNKPHLVEDLSRLLRKVETWQRGRRILGDDRS